MCLSQVGGNEDSNVYIRMKSKAATQCGIAVDHIKLQREVRQLVGVYTTSDECKNHVSIECYCCMYIVSHRVWLFMHYRYTYSALRFLED